MGYIDDILEMAYTHPFRMKTNKWLFGKRYKAYFNEDVNKYVLCECELFSLSARLEMYRIYKHEFMNPKYLYRDCVEKKEYEILTLKDFLGLPDELNIDYEKDIRPQIRLDGFMCHRCCGFNYEWNLPVSNPENLKSLKNKVKDCRREIEKENYFISKFIHYVPILQKSYVIVDALNDEQKDYLKLRLEDFDIKDKWCVGHQQFVENEDKEKQIAEVKKFLELPLDVQLKFVYRNYTIEERDEIANKFDKRYLCLTSTYTSEYCRAVHLDDIKNVDRRVKDLQGVYLKDLAPTTDPTELVKTLYYATINKEWSEEDVKDMKYFLNMYIRSNAPSEINCGDDEYDIKYPLYELALKTEDSELVYNVGKKLKLVEDYDKIPNISQEQLSKSLDLLLYCAKNKWDFEIQQLIASLLSGTNDKDSMIEKIEEIIESDDYEEDIIIQLEKLKG